MQDEQALPPGFMVVHGNHLEDLRELALQWMRKHPLRPLENEVLLVQSNGIAQWLKLALAAEEGLGIAAAIQVELPARFLWQAYRSVLGDEQTPEHSPLDKQPLTWRLMRLLPELLQAPAFAPLQRFLANDQDLRKRHQLAERLADLFDQYQVYRADWLADWAEGRDQLRTSRRGIRPLEDNARWQAELWRALLADVGPEHLAGSRAGVHPRFLERLRTLEAAPAGLPRRITVFGISSLPAQTLEALAALARFSQVLLCVHNPCQHHWGDIVEDKDLLRHEYRRQQRKPGLSANLDASELHQHAHPLLAAWGKQGRDYMNLLDQHDQPHGYQQRFAALGGRIDLFGEANSRHLLGQLQDDILDLRPLAETREHWPPFDPSRDHSLRFQLAHSAQREVEILHDQLLQRFNDEADLRPRDIIVMVPDINTYAPHIQAVFGQYGHDDPRHIPFTLADQGRRGRDPLLIALEHLLKLPDTRLNVSEVLDLLDIAALRERFAIGAGDLPTLQRWIEGAGVRWGLDAAHRGSLGQSDGLEQNTWHFGLRRMLLGYAMGDSGACAGIEPFDEIGGLEAVLIGPLVRLLDELQQALQALRQPATPQAWGERLRQLLERFFLARDEREEILLGQLLEALDSWLELCAQAHLEQPLPLTVVREAWLGGLDESRLSQRFLAGAVNFCTLMPMRAIPFRQVCLLGMNDGDYPRSQAPLDFDLMAGDYRPGDRSRREDDRYLLLEALLSARDRLYISWVARSIRDNSERPPSVLIGQLRDHLGNGWRLADGGDLLAALTTEHPLQPFSRRYFSQDDGPLFSYAREWAAVHQPGAHERADAPLAEQPQEQPLELESLQSFLRAPVRFFFSRRLKAYLDEAQQTELDSEPFALDGLQRHQMQQQLLEAASLAPDYQQALERQAAQLQRSGQLPLAGFGTRLREQLLQPLPQQIRRYHALCAGLSEPRETPSQVSFEQDGLRLSGWLSGLRRDEQDALQRIELLPGSLAKGKQLKWHRLLRTWVAHVAGSASELPLATLLVAEDISLRFAPLPADEARGLLATWLQAWRQGMCQPLPVALKSAFAWLAQEDPQRAWEAAQQCYEGGFQLAGEVAGDASLARQYPDFASLAADGRFAEWSRLLYLPLLEFAPERLADAEDAP
ncbi:exodeoxyribonuclease V subunit gamma [Stutzerimonas kirkiae]|uniref:RecBCD enzyme subunit RecC n=1 Tax=Stutzerimonas kirkiae TaxID=2211392 RepID=A0A4Q9R0W4_9GAMM|nr:exodeoxyribonuclease V subunit gamma [Stutzerimonas kirkiae]TBU90341.1 exodeoxyribonuclease V subunit gamma [Stutzerimonas kirkiae]TBU99576.1 exodeoxyribonuclease V subunit gamma [Stutzerimonas kirkiae]